MSEMSLRVSERDNREVLPGVKHGLNTIFRGSPQLSELVQLEFIRGMDEDWEPDNSPTSTFSERFQDRLTGGDVVAIVQEAAYRLLPHLQDFQKNYDRNVLSPSLLDDDGNATAGLVMAFDKLAPDTIGEPKWLCLVEDLGDETLVYGVVFVPEEYSDPLRDGKRIIKVTGLKLFYPGTFKSVESLEEASLEGQDELRSSTTNPHQKDVHLVVRKHTNEGEQLHTILGYLDKLVEEYLPVEP